MLFLNVWAQICLKYGSLFISIICQIFYYEASRVITVCFIILFSNIIKITVGTNLNLEEILK